ncbi:hypothetical protein [Halovivax cerinus]|uniref:Uncharacterized protein n=1 Tax=Halovivax cerinus TaxID=1487865 RepID=A0ABD5NQ49_9EURY
MNNQARRFAQYYVYCERGYDTVPPHIHPERLNAVRVAIATLSESAFEHHFGDLYQQLRSHEDAGIERVVPIPSAAKRPDSVLYRKNAYLGVNPLETEFASEAESIAARHGLDLSAETLETRSLGGVTDAALDAWREVGEELAGLVDAADGNLSESLELAGTSSLHMTYIDDRGEEHVTDSDEPFDRDPDARFELPVMDAGSLSEFQDYLNHNLACQVRDAFVRMGLQPPEPFQILGYGDFEAAEQYKRLDMYPNYVDPELETQGLFSKLTSLV